MGKPIKIAILGDEKDLVRATGKSGAAMEDMARSASKAADKVDREFASAADAADNMGSASSQAAGGLGDLGGALALMPGPLGGIGAGMEALTPAIMGVTGAADLANLALKSNIVVNTKAKIATVAKAVADKAAAAGTKAYAAAQWVLNAAMSANPIGLLIVGLVALGAGLVIAYKKSETFRKIVNKAFSVVKNVAAGVVRFFTRNVPAGFEKIRNAAGKALGWVKSNWPKITAPITRPIALAVTAVSRSWDKIKSGATSVKRWVTDRLGDMVGYVRGMPGKIARAASGMWDGLKNAFRSALNWVIDKWNSFELSVDIPKILGGGSVGIGTPNIPRLASGGIVKARPGGILANIGEGRYDEAVVPLKGGGLGDTYNINVTVPVGASPVEVGRAIVKAIQAFKGAGGRVSFA